MRYPLLACALLLVLGCQHERSLPGATTGDDKPRLVVLLVVDQLPSWSFVPRMPLFARGLGRLLREGAVFTQARYPYSSTLTAVGHSALSTGAPPAVTGIIANEWWDREQGKKIESITDDGYPLLVVQNGWRGELVSGRGRQSPFRLRAEGIADALRSATNGVGKSVGVSLKGRAAMFSTGRKADLALWYDDGQRAFTTSTWYATSVPGWLGDLARNHPIGPRLVEEWLPTDRTFLEKNTGEPDDSPGEALTGGHERSFPHRPLTLPVPAESIKTSPLGNTVTVEAALAAVDGMGLGKHDAPDYLSVSFSATDYVGHVWGQESWEELDILMRLDGDIAILLDGLEQRVGKGRVAVVLSSDHGSTRMPEKHPGAIRVDCADVGRAADRAVTAIAGKGKWVDFERDPSIYFSKEFRQLDAKVKDQALDAATEAIAKLPGIGYAGRTDKLAGHCDERPETEALYCRAIDPERSGEIIFGPAAGSLILDTDGDSISHGSANLDDRTVPVIVWGPGVRQGRHDEPVSSLQVAPTLARLLGIPAPKSAKEKPLI